MLTVIVGQGGRGGTAAEARPCRMPRAATAGTRLWTAPALRLMKRADTAGSTARPVRPALEVPEAPAVQLARRAAQEAKGRAEAQAKAAGPRTGPEETAVPAERVRVVRTTVPRARPGTRS